MTWAVLSYLFGAFCGELIRFALWLNTQPPGKGPRDYFNAQKGQVILSGAVALVACYAWAEGTLMKVVVDRFNLDWPQTTGVTIIAGAVISIFAPQILKLVGRKGGLDDAKETP